MPAFQRTQVSVSVSCKATTASFHTVLFCAAPTPAASSYRAVRTALPLLLQRRRPRQHHFHSGVNKHGLRRKKKRATIPRLSTNASLFRKVDTAPIRDASPPNGGRSKVPLFAHQGVGTRGHEINSPNIDC